MKTIKYVPPRLACFSSAVKYGTNNCGYGNAAPDICTSNGSAAKHNCDPSGSGPNTG